MHLLYFLIFGLLVGAIARLLMPGTERGGWFTSMLLGVAGAFVGGFLSRFLGVYGEGGAAGFIVSVIGAMLLIAGYHVLGGRQRFGSAR